MNKNLNFKCNINVKGRTSGVYQKRSALNLLVPIKQLMVASNIYRIIDIIKIFFTTQKDFSQLVIINIKNIGNNTTDSVQEGLPFMQIVWTVKKVMRRIFNIFGAIAYQIKSILKTVLELEFTKVTQANSQSC